MCLGIPMRVIEKKEMTGVVELGGVRHEANLQLVEEVEVGDYLIIHAGFAIQKLDEKEARETIALLNEVFREGTKEMHEIPG
mgnify:CR=1 FL=1